MWSRLKQLSGLFGKKEQTPAQVVDGAIKEIEKVIAIQENAVFQASKHESEIYSEVLKLRGQADALHKDAQRAVLRNDDAQASMLLAREAPMREQLASFEKMHQQALSGMQHLEAQVAKLKLKLGETKGKRIMLIAKLESAKTQNDLNNYLNEVGTEVFGGLESALEAAELSLAFASGKDLQDMAIEEALNRPQDSVAQLRREAEEAEAKRRQAIDAQRLAEAEKRLAVNQSLEAKRSQQVAKEEKASKENLLDSFFTATVPKAEAPTDFFAPKKEMPHADNFFAQETPPKVPHADNFFAQETPPKVPNIDDFFNQPLIQKPNPDAGWANDILRELSEKQEPKPNKDQQIDDFFKD